MTITDTTSKASLRDAWSDWFDVNKVDLRREYSDRININNLNTTAYVKDGVAYKLLKGRNSILRVEGIAIKMWVPSDVLERRLLNEAVRVIESDRVGLAMLRSGGQIMPGDIERMGLRVEVCPEHQGPPPEGSDYAEVDWIVRRSSPEWCINQYYAQVFGPQRVQRCMHGAARTGYRTVWEVSDAIDLTPADLGIMTVCGAGLIPDHLANENPDTMHVAGPATLKARSLLWLANFEINWPGAPHWTVEQMKRYNEVMQKAPQ